MPKTKFYLIVEATRTRYGVQDPETGLKPVGTVRVAGVRVSRPAKLDRDQVAIKMTVDVPDGVFNPVVLAAAVVIPEGLVLKGPISVEAFDANSEEDN